MGLPEKREDQDQRRDCEAYRQAVAEGLPRVSRVAAERAREAEKVSSVPAIATAQTPQESMPEPAALLETETATP